MGAGARRDPAKWEHWRRVIADWENTGLNGADYCRRRDIPYSQFKDWLKRLRREDATPSVRRNESGAPNVAHAKMRTPPELLTRKEAAQYLGIAEQTLACWKSSGRHSLPMVKVGRLSKYRRADLDAFLDNNTSTPDSAEARRQAATLRAAAIAKATHLRQQQESIEFAEATVKDSRAEVPAESQDGHLEIVFRSGTTLKLTAGAPVELLSSVISLLENI
jgi:excisionase family DNA binding protein